MSETAERLWDALHGGETVSNDTQVKQEAPQMDWQQFVLNGGPPCFYVDPAEPNRYCGRAERWVGHNASIHHDFVSLDDLLATVRKEEREAALDDAISIVGDFMNLSGKKWVAKYGISYNVGGLISVLAVHKNKKPEELDKVAAVIQASIPVYASGDLISRTAAKAALCYMCADPERYKPAQPIEGSMRLFHFQGQSNWNAGQCFAQAINTVPAAAPVSTIAPVEQIDKVANRVNAAVARMDESQKVDAATMEIEFNPAPASPVAPVVDAQCLICDSSQRHLHAYADHAFISTLDLEVAKREFFNASIAVWREIDRLSALPDGYHGLLQGADPRKRELAAWEAYRALLDALAKHKPKAVPASTVAPQEQSEPWSDEGGHVWERRPNVECVGCPHCCFTFAAVHTDGNSGGYSCPNCQGCPDASPLAPASEGRRAAPKSDMELVCTNCDREIEKSEYGPPINDICWSHVHNGVVWCDWASPAADWGDPGFKSVAIRDEAETFQSRVQPWMMACFGAEISSDKEERNHRFLEEALELVQACGASRSESHQLVDYTFDRPIGSAQQEVGGVMVTLAALCLAQGFNMHECGEVELTRIWSKVDVIRAKQAAKPKHSPLPEHVATTPPSTRAKAAAQEIARRINGGEYEDLRYPQSLLAMMDDPSIANEAAFAAWLESIILKRCFSTEGEDTK